MVSPLEDAFKKKLQLFKDQSSGVSKETNLSKRIDKLKKLNKNDFQQQRQIQHTLVKNTAVKPEKTETPNKVVNYVPGAKALVIGGSGGEVPSVKSKGGTKLLSAGKRWTTSGYVPLTSNMFNNTSLKNKSKSLKKKV